MMKAVILFMASLTALCNLKSTPINSNLEGLWINENTETPGITKCNIRYDNIRFHVQIWGKCQPSDCDWGETSSNEIIRDTEKLSVFWENGFVKRFQTLQIIDGKLTISTENRYKDGRPNNSHIETFVKK